MNKKIKILMISPLPPPNGGIGTWTKIVQEDLKSDNNFELTIVDVAARWRKVTNKNLIIRLLGGTLQFFRDFGRAVFSSLVSRPDLVHLSGSRGMGFAREFAIIHWMKLINVPVVYQFHGGDLHLRLNRPGLFKKLMSRNIRLSKFFLAITLDVEKFVKQEFPDKNIDYMPNLVDMNKIVSLAKGGTSVDTVNKKDRFRIVYLGWVIETKGITELVKSCKNLDNIDLLLVGPIDDNYKEHILEIAGENSSDWLYITGSQSHENSMKYVDSADVFILPSYTEGFPMVITEAMTLAKPIIATRVGALPEILDENKDNPSGLLINAKSVDDISEALNKLINNDKLREELANNAYLKVKNNYSVEVVLSKLKTIWKLSVQH